jgi:hypothetical protein
MEVRNLPDSRLPDQPGFGEGWFQGALPGLERLVDVPKVKAEGLGLETPDLVSVQGGHRFEENGGSPGLSMDNEVCIAWLEGALQRLRPEGQEKVVGYLEAVLEEVVFEMKAAPRS